MTTENKYHSRVGDDNIYQAQEGEYLIVSDIPPSRAHLHEGLGIYELGFKGLSVSLYHSVLNLLVYSLLTLTWIYLWFPTFASFSSLLGAPTPSPG